MDISYNLPRPLQALALLTSSRTPIYNKREGIHPSIHCDIRKQRNRMTQHIIPQMAFSGIRALNQVEEIEAHQRARTDEERGGGL